VPSVWVCLVYRFQRPSRSVGRVRLEEALLTSWAGGCLPSSGASISKTWLIVCRKLSAQLRPDILFHLLSLPRAVFRFGVWASEFTGFSEGLCGSRCCVLRPSKICRLELRSLFHGGGGSGAGVIPYFAGVHSSGRLLLYFPTWERMVG